MNDTTISVLQERALGAPISELKHIRPLVLERLNRYGICTIEDLLFFFPIRYEDKTRITPILAARIGDRIQIEGVIAQVNVQYAKKPMLICKVKDGSGIISLRFFHFTHYQRQNLKIGQRIRCFGEVRRSRHGLELIHPQYVLLNDHMTLPVNEHFTSVYPKLEGIQSKALHEWITQALKIINAQTNHYEYLPEHLRKQFQLIPLHEALNVIHHPSPSIKVDDLVERRHPAFRRFSFEELLAHHLCLRKLKQIKKQKPSPVIISDGTLVQKLIEQLPFKLTRAQEKVLKEIREDISSNKPMMRLVQGDVGSGKTIVAILASMEAIATAYQVAIMAPTEILAEQHYHLIQSLLAKFEIRVDFLSSAIAKKERKALLESIEKGETSVVVGTHALFQEDVIFNNLGFIIIDEQHRFGVEQRLKLRDKGNTDAYVPHQLVMSATPIPRTLAMTFFADLDVSIIDELPVGRLPVITAVISNERRDEIVNRIKHMLEKGQQVYWVCALIEESEHLICEPVELAVERLKITLPHCTIASLHGRMSSAEKEKVMQQFKNGNIQILVATTVIEVGIDIPNATLMVIENAERLGLSQLHQLRGRVGRGSQQSYCILMYQSPLSETAVKRLEVMKHSNSGFEVAKEDLKIRGPGDFLGTQQTGLFNFKIADISRDYALLKQIPDCATYCLKTDPALVEKIIKRWLPMGIQYASV